MATNSVMKLNPLFVSTKSTDIQIFKFSLLLPFRRMPAQVRAASSTEGRRKSVSYQPNAWSFDLLDSSRIHHVRETYKEKASRLEAEVKDMILEKKPEITTTISLIDEVEKLGLGYHYASEIRTALGRIVLEEGAFNQFQSNLNATALTFRLLRQHGYNVSVEVFAKFKSEDGYFKEWVKEDIKGMMSLYEALHVGFPGETLLDEANLFTKSHLKEIKEKLSKDVQQQIDHVLELPFHRRVQRVEAEWNIRAYSKRQDANQVLLELAVMDFNMVQSFLQRDLQHVLRWDVNAINHLPDYMKLCFFALYNTVNEMAYEILKEKGEIWGDMCKTFLQEAKWFHQKYTPSYEEYVEVGWLSSSGPLLLVHAYFFLNGNYTKEELEHIQNYHDLLRWPSFIFRLANDLGSSSADLERGDSAKSILCCMKDYGICEERAKEKISDSIDETWKKMNKERINNTDFSKSFR